ncbi:hypothetical protein [Cellulomonas sp. SG140]|uniref:hypothetical protein n=1 Tax=Cellulomonas sp. SG140 TaxID=2976536 RepID=UPI0021E8EA7B|nr:hypothetical protein [Cellulomonas sp. SG140]
MGTVGRPRHITVWTAAATEGSVRPTTLADVPGDVVGVSADGSAGLTAIGGTTWQDGHYSSYLVTSRDRSAWSSVALPADVAASRITRVAVPNAQTVVVAGDGLQGRAQRVSVLDTSRGTWTSAALPAPGPTSRQTITGLDATPDLRVLVTLSAGADGELPTPVSFVSSDKGATFTGPTSVAPKGSSIAGVVWASTTFVATGGIRVGGDTRRPRAWTTQDGASWTSDEHSALEVGRNGKAAPDIDAQYGAPTEVSGVVDVTVSPADLPNIFFWRRGTSGGWQQTGSTTRALAIGPSSLAVADGSSAPAVVSGGSRSLREYRWAEQSGDFTSTDLVSATSAMRTSMVEAGAGAINTAVGAQRFTQTAESWSTSAVQRYGQLTDDGLAPVDWGPSGLPGSVDVKSAADPQSGTTVVAATKHTDGAFPGFAWVKTSGADWAPSTGFDGGTFRHVTAVEHLDTGWYIAAQEAATTSYDSARPETIWHSNDGVQWTAIATGLLAEGAHEATVNDLCSDGTRTVAVGRTLTQAGVSTATWWSSDGGPWVTGSLDSVGGEFDSCAVQDGGFRATGTVDGRSGMWTTSDLKTFAPDLLLDHGLERAAAVRVDSGWVAGGSVDTADYSGPVLWTSRDGVQWSWQRVPVGTESSRSTVETAGRLLAVLVDTADGVAAWRVSLGPGPVVTERRPTG